MEGFINLTRGRLFNGKLILLLLTVLTGNAQADVILLTPKELEQAGSKVKHSTASVSGFAKSSAPVLSPIILPAHENNAFNVGERLRFIIKYEFIKAGNATMDVNEGPLINGYPTYHFESKAESTNFIDKFFKVRDVNSSTVDKRSMASLFFHQNLREGNYHVIRNTTLDYTTRTYTWEKTYKGKVTQDTGSISQPLEDILSAFFYIRTMPLELNKEYSVTVFSDKDTFPLKVKVFPKTEKIRVPAGKFECLRIEPLIVGDAIFKAKGGSMIIWLTNDDKKMPVLLRSKVFIGAFDAELLEYSLGD